MGIYSAFLFGLLIGVVVGEDTCAFVEDSLIPVTTFVTAEQYRVCKEEGVCTIDPPCGTWADYDENLDSLEGKSYFEICRRIHFKMEQLQDEHPEVKHLKLKLLQIMNKLSELESESLKGERAIIKILDYVKNLIEKLRAEFEDGKHGVYEPATLPPKTIVTEEEVTAEPEHEPGHSLLVGSIRGIPGVHFPNYTEIPITSFSCSDKTIIPGFYADLETGCQVFHLCYEHRRESFLCPIGTIFNQPILACDYWYSANCSQAPIYYEDTNIPEPESIPTDTTQQPEKEVTDFFKFLPVKAKVIDIPKPDMTIPVPILKPPVTLVDTEAVADKIFDGILSLGSKVASQTSEILKKLPDPKHEAPVVSISDKFPLAAAVPLAKAKKITSAAKLSAAVKIASAAAALPIKAKVATAAAKVDVSLVKAKVALKKFPVVKGKLFKVPLVKTKFAAVPALKAKKAVKAVPYLKMAALKPKLALKVKSAVPLPLVKAKLAKAAISPLTKKTLALGYLKLLKTKKLALMG